MIDATGTRYTYIFVNTTYLIIEPFKFSCFLNFGHFSIKGFPIWNGLIYSRKCVNWFSLIKLVSNCDVFVWPSVHQIGLISSFWKIDLVHLENFRLVAYVLALVFELNLLFKSYSNQVLQRLQRVEVTRANTFNLGTIPCLF